LAERDQIAFYGIGLDRLLRFFRPLNDSFFPSMADFAMKSEVIGLSENRFEPP